MREREAEWSGLLRAANAGDAAAYHKLLKALAGGLRPVVRGACARYGRAHADVEDIVQDVLLAVHTKRHTWDSEQPVGPWLRAVVHHKVIDHLRRGGRRIEVPIDDVIDVLPAEETGDSLDQADAGRMVAKLQGRARDVVTSISINGESIRDVATRLGMTEGAVRVALHRGLATLASIYRKSGA